MKFQGEGFQKLEHEQDRQTDRQTRPNALRAAFAGDSETIRSTTHELY